MSLKKPEPEPPLRETIREHWSDKLELGGSKDGYVACYAANQVLGTVWRGSKGQQLVRVSTFMSIRAGRRSSALSLRVGEGAARKARIEPMHPDPSPMNRSPRCGARRRSGRPCQSPAVSGRKRCRMHGGASGSGARAGNTNALRHGRYSRELIEFRQTMRELLRDTAKKLELV